jgi:hypothetical protein
MPRNRTKVQSLPPTDNEAPAADRHATGDAHMTNSAKEAAMATEPSRQAGNAADLADDLLSGASPTAMVVANAALTEPLDLATTRIETPARPRRSKAQANGSGADTGSVKPDTDIGIPKPDDGFNLDDFRSNADTSGVGTLLGPLPHYKIADANDFVRLHPDEKTHWTPELCFLSVPIVGQSRDQLHLIKKEIAVRNQVPVGRLSFFRLALATKPFDQFFLCHVPSRNLDNAFNADAIRACEIAKEKWVMAVSKKKSGKAEDGYDLTLAIDQDAFFKSNWASAGGLWDLIKVTWSENLRIISDDHPGLLRVLGKRLPLG